MIGATDFDITKVDSTSNARAETKLTADLRRCMRIRAVYHDRFTKNDIDVADP
jgi:hypothetical protein